MERDARQMTPYEQGYKAYGDRLGTTDNPYPYPGDDAPDSDPHWRWYHGYVQAERIAEIAITFNDEPL